MDLGQSHFAELFTSANLSPVTGRESKPDLVDPCDRLTRTGRVPTCAAACTDPRSQLACARLHRRRRRGRARTGAATSSSFVRAAGGKTKAEAGAERATGIKQAERVRSECADESKQAQKRASVEEREKAKLLPSMNNLVELEQLRGEGLSEACGGTGACERGLLPLDTCCALPFPTCCSFSPLALIRSERSEAKSTSSSLTFRLPPYQRLKGRLKS